MFPLMKPGHILRFTTCPSTIDSPGGMKGGSNDNTLATPWPTTSYLGAVQCLSHPSGNIGPIAAYVAMNLRSTPASKSRTISYSGPGRMLTRSNRLVGSETCDFVGYVDGQSNYVQSTRTVFSKDFSGCLMVVYTHNTHRHVAHAAASLVPMMDCKQAFLDTLQNMNASLVGWFKPYVEDRDFDRKAHAFQSIKQYIGNDPNKLTTFGVVTQAGQAYSVDAFKPKGIGGNDWVVADIVPRVMSQDWKVT